MSSSLFSELSTELDAISSPIYAAETHGSLCGLFCLQTRPDFDLWYSLIIDEKHQAQPARLQRLIGLLGQVRQETETAFASHSGGVDLLLPEDDDVITARLSALVQWCEGLLYGLGVAGLAAEHQLPDQAREFVQDVREITKLDAGSVSEEAEHDYMELVEYLRVGVLVLREELLPDAKLSPIAPNKTQH